MVREEFIAEATGLLGDSNIQELSEERFVGHAGQFEHTEWPRSAD